MPASAANAAGARWKTALRVGLSLVIGLCGAQLFVFIGTPLPWLLGAIFAALVATHIPRLPLQRPIWLTHPARAVLGLAIGSTFTPAVFDEVGRYALSLAIMPLLLVVVVGLGFVYYQRVTGFDRRTAYFCALPGGMIEMSLICEELGADLRRVMLSQATRVLLIVYSVPFLVEWLGGIDLGGRRALTLGGGEPSLHDTVVLVLAALIGNWTLHRLRLFGASILGPMAAAIVVYSAGWASMRPPPEWLIVAQLVLGTSVGCTFVGLALREVVRSIVHTLGFFSVTMLASMAIAWLAHLLTGISPIATALAFIPGGQAEMNLIAIAAGMLVPYVALHHIVRMLLVLMIAPQVASWVIGARPGKAT